MKTSVGDLECELWPERAPATVANFVGLANGTRPWKSRRGVVREPAFDTAVFDRVLPGLLLGVARTGEVGKDAPGYTLPDEAWPAMKHDRAGLLCAGRNPAFDWLITAGPAPLLDRAPDAGPRPRFTVFGSCGPIKLIEAIANAPSKRGKPVTAIHVEQVRVTRR